MDFYAQREYWIAKSEQVHLQARYWPTNVTSGLSVTKEFVFSVSFVKCNVVCLSAMATSWNGQAMIPTFPSNLSNDLVFYARGEYWIARSEEVHIQACYRPTHMTSGLSVTKKIAQWLIREVQCCSSVRTGCIK